METRCLVSGIMGCPVPHWVSIELHHRPGITQVLEQSKVVDALRFDSAYAGMLISLLRVPGLQQEHDLLTPNHIVPNCISSTLQYSLRLVVPLWPSDGKYPPRTLQNLPSLP